MVTLMLNFFLLVSQTIKSILREPRPLFVDADIDVSDCKHMEFGNPSSHTYHVSVVLPALCWLLIKHYEIEFKAKCPVLLKLGSYLLIFMFIFILGFSRVFKGVHTYNQVLNGFVQGIILSAIFVFVLYEDIFKFYVSLKHRSW